MTCPMCGGLGTYFSGGLDTYFIGLWLPCPNCGGTGDIKDEEEKTDEDY